jgi:hypothetical protein
MTMVKRTIALIIALVLVAAVPIAYVAMSSGAAGDQDDLDRHRPVFTDDPVTILGRSELTDIITDRLERSTSRITITDNLTFVASTQNDTILIIDGAWVDRVSLREVAEAIRPLILNGTPTIVLGKTVDLLRAAVDDVAMGSSEAALDGETMIAQYNCIRYDSETKLSEEYSYTASHPDGLEEAVTLTYNWAVGTG